MMRTGFGEIQPNLQESYMKCMIDITLPIVEQSVILAAEYSNACGRNVVLAEDMEYAMKYCTMNLVGKHIGSIAPDVYDEEESEEEESDEEEEEEDPPFERYSGDDPKFILVNEAYDNWDDWVPQNPTEQMLKNAINSNEHI